MVENPDSTANEIWALQQMKTALETLDLYT